MSGRIAAGVDLGGTKIHSLVATEEGEVLGEDRCLTLAEEGPDAVVERMTASLARAIEAAGVDKTTLAGAGISSPGPCAPAEGIVTNAPNLPGFVDFPLARRIETAVGLPTLLENDANAAAYGEYRFGAGQGYRHLLYVTVSTGIGGGIIIDGSVYWGASGAAGEVGHIVIDEDGPLCNCGARGCVEAFSSGLAIARDAAAALEAGQAPLLARLCGDQRPTAELVHRAALEGDATAREIIERAGRRLGLGFIGLLNCFNPQALVIGGGLVALGDLYLGLALEVARSGAFDQVVQDVTISTANLGERAGALGAAALMLQKKPL